MKLIWNSREKIKSIYDKIEKAELCADPLKKYWVICKSLFIFIASDIPCMETIKKFADIGIIPLLFAVGIEFSKEMVISLLKKVFQECFLFQQVPF